MSHTMTPEAIAFITELERVDMSLAIWAEVRIDGGQTLDDTRARLRAAMRIVQGERSTALLRELREEVRDWQDALSGERDGLDPLCERIDAHLSAPPKREEPRSIGDIVDEEIDRAAAEGRHLNDAR